MIHLALHARSKESGGQHCKRKWKNYSISIYLNVSFRVLVMLLHDHPRTPFNVNKSDTTEISVRQSSSLVHQGDASKVA